MILSPQQDEALRRILAWHKDPNAPKRFVLAGYAGAGKSTLSKRIAAIIAGETGGDVYFAAYTGKAAQVLREKGCYNVNTIHGSLYIKVGNSEPPVFALNEDSVFALAELVIIDEYSMLPEEIIIDIERVSKKVLYLGDPFQLPPVSGKCSLEPDYFIEEIHRQALESPIIRYSTDVRQGKQLEFCQHPEFVYAPKNKIDPDRYEEVDQIIVGLNKTRAAFNFRFRQKNGLEAIVYPIKGEKLICLKNNHQLGLFNGMIGEATSDCRHVGFQELKLDFEGFTGLQVWNGDFKLDPKPPQGINKKFDRFDYGYAITCHKSQGSEFDDLLIYSQPIGSNSEEKRRWLYTAITRGKKKVTLVQP